MLKEKANILDVESQANFITERLVSILNLYHKSVDILEYGIENNCTNIRLSTMVIVRSKVSILIFLSFPALPKQCRLPL